MLCVACGPDIVYEDSSALPATGWPYGDSLTYTFPVTDTSSRYDLVLTVEHTEDFAFQNFYVRLNTQLPGGTQRIQPLSLQLADNFGEWYGDCSGGNCTTEIALQEGTRFTELGEHRLVVTQFSREEILPEVTGMGFRIVRH
ncbi:Gliding motility lipoprotein GldH [Neolewinella maritima]|uniref:Gliding motility lipoprotein GldH n=1 Tax=Neolewinella maritima TaxID=1383882 RepID=A0ABM9AZE5_9BACT|nr:gliding motility lipoprotein GldH [Neolewinella maritima]CAH0999579.1 Gliding motility lipoprotein GldH [Neolewinella maritima]